MQEFFQRYLDKLDLTTVLENLLTKVISLLLLILLFYIAKKFLHVAVGKIVKPSLKFSNRDAGRQKTISRLLENIFNYTLYFFLIYCILSILGLPVSSLLAGAGIAGVAIGMGAQGFLSDLVNGFFILLERQLDVGDNVRLTNGSINIAGIVSSVGIRTTQVRDFDGTLHFVPNRNITVVSNLSRGDMRVLVDIPLDANTDLDKIYQVIAQVNQSEQDKHPEVLTGPTILGPQIEKNGRYSFRIAMTAQNGTQTTVYHTYYKLYHDALMEAGISLPTGKNGIM